MKKHTPILIVAIFLLSVTNWANAAQANEAHYLVTQSLAPELLPVPPREDSPAHKQQIAAVIAAQKHIKPDDLTAMRDEQHVHVELMTSALGPDFTRDHFPKSYALIDNVMHDTHAISDNAKQYWHTRRPYLVDKHVHLYVDRIDQNPAYPSGHTCFARVLAEVLGMIAPSKREELRTRADAIALHRIMAGVHYPVDVDGGKLLAMQIIGALMQNADFRADLAAAQAEQGQTP